jgi:hypothetical protein
MWLGVGLVGVIKRLIFFERWQLDRDPIRRRLLEIVTRETRQHHSDIILTAAIVRFFDQSITRLREIAFAGDNNVLNIFRAEFP